MRLLTPLALALSMAGLLAGCASTGINSDDPHAPMHEGREPAQMPGTASSSEMDSAPGKSETVRGDGKPDWAAVYETPPGTRYREQQLIYVDRRSLREHKLDKLTYFTATTREVRPAFSAVAVLHPAHSHRRSGAQHLRGEGHLHARHRPAPLTPFPSGACTAEDTRCRASACVVRVIRKHPTRSILPAASGTLRAWRPPPHSWRHHAQLGC